MHGNILGKEQSKGAKYVITGRSTKPVADVCEEASSPAGHSAWDEAVRVGFNPGPETAQKLPEPPQCQQPPPLSLSQHELPLRKAEHPERETEGGAPDEILLCL